MYTNVLKKLNKLEEKIYLNKKMDRLYLKEILKNRLSFLCACEVMNTKDKYA